MAARDGEWRGKEAGLEEEAESELGDSARTPAVGAVDYYRHPNPDYYHPNLHQHADNRSNEGRTMGAGNYQAYDNYPQPPQWGSARYREGAADQNIIDGGRSTASMTAMMTMDQEEQLFSASSSRLLLQEHFRSPPFLFEPAWPPLDTGYDKSALPDLDLPGFDSDQHLHHMLAAPQSLDHLARFPPPAPPPRPHTMPYAALRTSSSPPSHSSRDHHPPPAAARSTDVDDDESLSSSDSDDQGLLLRQILPTDDVPQALGVGAALRSSSAADAPPFPSFSVPASADGRSHLSSPDPADDKPALAAPELDGADHHPKASTKKTTAAKPRKKGQKRVREPRVALVTKSEVEHLEDGYRWRKYGQKAVKNSPHPRSYYRCTNTKCFVKKRVERCVEDPSLVVTTYEGQHTHHSPAVLRGRAMMEQPSSLGSTMQPPGSISPAAAMSLLLRNPDPLVNSRLLTNPHLNTSTPSLLQPFFQPRPGNFSQAPQIRQRSAPPFSDNYNPPFQTITSPLFISPNPLSAHSVNPNLINPNPSLVRPPPIDKGLLDDMLPPASRKPPPPSSS